MKDLENKIRQLRSEATKGKKRNYKMKDSFEIRFFLKYYRNHRPKKSEYVLDDTKYCDIVRSINYKIADLLVEGHPIIFPKRLGGLEVRKYKPTTKIDGKTGKIRSSLAVNWNATFKLWAEDEECRKNKTIVRIETDYIYKFYFNQCKAKFNNKEYYTFKVNQRVRKLLKNKADNGELEAYELYNSK